MNKNSKIYIAGHTGQVGQSILQTLYSMGYSNLITISKEELDLRNQYLVDQFFATIKPDYVFLSAATVGGINANQQYPADFAYDNLMISLNIINSSYKSHVKKLLYLGSTCIYPPSIMTPLQENNLLLAPPEITNEAYALSKIIGIKLCEYYNTQYKTNFISAIPCNTYGPYDHFFCKGAHVIPDLFCKFSSAFQSSSPEVILQGDGNAIREYIYSLDLADACIYLMNNYSSPFPINIGSGYTITIRELAYKIASLCGYKGHITFSLSGANGASYRYLDSHRINNMGWTAKTDLNNGLKYTYQIFSSKYLTK